MLSLLTLDVAITFMLALIKIVILLNQYRDICDRRVWTHGFSISKFLISKFLISNLINLLP